MNKASKEYKELMDFGKKVFNFHPDEEFKSIKQLLHAGKKNSSRHEYYDQAAALLAKNMASYIDNQQAV